MEEDDCGWQPYPSSGMVLAIVISPQHQGHFWDLQFSLCEGLMHYASAKNNSSFPSITPTFMLLLEFDYSHMRYDLNSSQSFLLFFSIE